MARNGQGIYELPSGYKATTGTTVLASQHNQPLEDIAQEQNATRPLQYGGTGANTAIGALDNLRRRSTSIASDTTVDLTGSTGDLVHITGTTTIEGFASQAAGNERTIVFDGALTLTHDADSFILPGGDDITTAAGDTGVFRSEGSGNWRCTSYQKASGEPIAPYPSAPYPSLSDLPWLSKPIGEPFPLMTNLDGVNAPPTDSSLYRFIELTAGLSGSGAYNENCLTNESTSGSAPLNIATAEISLSDSPMLGATVHLINTERAFLRGGASPGTLEQDAMQQITGRIRLTNSGTFVNENNGAFRPTGSVSYRNQIESGSGMTDMYFDSAYSPNARTSAENRPKNLGVKYFMRIK